MPILTAHITAGCTSEQKKALLEQSTQAVVKSLNAPLHSIRMTLQEYPDDCSIVAGEVGAKQLIYVAYLIEGRGPELKSALIAALTEAAGSAVGLSSDDVRVIIRDVPKTDMGVAGGISALAAGR
ncbi:MAG TPA: tautomerase family protein [Burkholderiaceae bacterium]|nr:tautomerase family protein [Burkholderiaceae bacterium]